MKLQSVMIEAGDNACLALCYIGAKMLYEGVENLDEFENSMQLSLALFSAYEDKAGLDLDFFVNDGNKLLNYIGAPEKTYIEKRVVTSLTDLRKDEYAAVKFTYGDKAHWVLAKNGFIAYDSLDNSQCRKYGKPTDARVIHFEGK